MWAFRRHRLYRACVPAGHVLPLKGHWGTVGDAASTELLSPWNKASVVVVTLYGAVVPWDIPPRCTRLCKSAPVANSPVRGQSSVEGSRRRCPTSRRDGSSVGDVFTVVAHFGAVAPVGHTSSLYRLSKSAPAANSPVRGQSSVEREPPPVFHVPQGQKLGRTKNITVPRKRPFRDETNDEKNN